MKLVWTEYQYFKTHPIIESDQDFINLNYKYKYKYLNLSYKFVSLRNIYRNSYMYVLWCTLGFQP